MPQDFELEFKLERQKEEFMKWIGIFSVRFSMAHNRGI